MLRNLVWAARGICGLMAAVTLQMSVQTPVHAAVQAPDQAPVQGKAALTPLPEANPEQLTPYSLERSAIVNVTAPDGERYSVMVAWPEGEPPPSGWPVLYVLDGEDNFAIATLTARRFARAGERSGVEPGIVVGIGAGPLARRARDYTPPTPEYRIPAGRPAAGLETGGGEAFLDLLESEIMPMVQRRWQVDSTRETLAGHSFGGLLGIHTLLTRPELFDAVVAVSPSFWFGDGLLAREAEGILTSPSRASNPRGDLVIATGGLERGAASAAEAFLETYRKAVPTGNVRHLDIAGQSHGGTMLAAFPQIISAAFGPTLGMASGNTPKRVSEKEHP